MLESKSRYITVITTTDTDKNARDIIDALLDKRVAACIQKDIVKSSYIWKEEIAHCEEIKLTIKSRSDLFIEIKRTIKELHNYEVPEIISIPILDIDREYGKWIESVCSFQK